MPTRLLLLFCLCESIGRYLESLITSQLPDGEMLNGWPPQGATGITEQATGDLTDPSWSAVLPEVAYHLWKSYGCEVCLDNAWPALLKYYSLLEANFTVTPHTCASYSAGCGFVPL